MPALIHEYVSQFVAVEEATGQQRRAAFVAWGVATCVALCFVGVVLLAPWLRAGGHVFLSGVIYRGFSVACHQMPERSFHLLGFPLAVCARCFGLYVGALAGVAVYPLLARNVARSEQPARVWLFVAALPTTVDFALGFFGLWSNTHLSRFLTASLFGAVAAFYIVPGLVDLSRMAFRRMAQAHTAAVEVDEMQRRVQA